MRTFLGIALGFALMPATLALVGGFVALDLWLELRREDLLIGYALGIAVLIVSATIFLRLTFAN